MTTILPEQDHINQRTYPFVILGLTWCTRKLGDETNHEAGVSNTVLSILYDDAFFFSVQRGALLTLKLSSVSDITIIASIIHYFVSLTNCCALSSQHVPAKTVISYACQTSIPLSLKGGILVKESVFLRATVRSDDLMCSQQPEYEKMLLPQGEKRI